MFLDKLTVCTVIANLLFVVSLSEDSPDNETKLDSLETDSLLFIGDPIPENCTAFYNCCDKLRGENEDCLKWCVKKLTCNKRRVLVRVPAYVEIATKPTPIDVTVEGITAVATTEDNALTDDDNTVKDILDVTESTVPKSKIAIQAVQVIDVPCRAGSLPDRRGRCREIW